MRADEGRDVLTKPPSAQDGDTLDTLRRVLQSAGFTVEAVEERLGAGELSLRRIDTAVHLRRLDEDDGFATITKLFLLGATVGAEALASALAPLTAERLAATGLIDLVGDSARPLARLAPHGDYYVASDADAAANTPFDYVPGIQAPSVTLAKLTVRRRVESALDLGTGCGIQALLAAKHARRVVATDINPRALAFAAFNARLNGIDTIDFRLGDAFEAVEGERFDVIVSNPPYVISPDASYAYRDSDSPADEICERIVRAAAGFLTNGGFAHVLVSWVDRPGGESAARLEEWLDAGCDAWLLHYRETNAIAYEQALDRWTSHLRGLGIDAIGYGAVVLRRRGSGRTWIRRDSLPLDRLEPAGDHTLRVFAGQDLLERASDSELLDARLVLTPQHTLEQQLEVKDGGFTVRAQILELTDGFRSRIGVDRHTASLLPHLDGRPLHEAFAAAESTFDLDDVEHAAYVPAALAVVRQLLGLGFLVEPG
jgi:hypothetical protein